MEKTDTKDLTSMPNIGKVIASQLVRAGITTPAQLTALGSCDAFIRLHTIDPGACLHQLMALEGAVQGKRWHNLDPQCKAELKEFFGTLRLK